MAVQLRRQSEDDDPAVVDIINGNRPTHVPTTIDLYRRRRADDSADDRREQWVADENGEVVGFFELATAHLGGPGRYYGTVEVPPRFRGRGTGSSMYDRMLELANELRTVRIYGSVPEDQPAGMAFADKRGFRKTGRADKHSRLQVSEAMIDGQENLEIELASQGIRIAPLAELGLDDRGLLERIHRMESETVLDIPSEEEIDPAPFEVWHKWLEGPGKSPEWFWIAMDGSTPAGLASLVVASDKAAVHGYTAVDRRYRGRGIARALKLKTIEWARARGIEFLYTDNDVDNLGMLGINQRLGYKSIPGRIEVMKDL